MAEKTEYIFGRAIFNKPCILDRFMWALKIGKLSIGWVPFCPSIVFIRTPLFFLVLGKFYEASYPGFYKGVSMGFWPRHFFVRQGEMLFRFHFKKAEAIYEQE